MVVATDNVRDTHVCVVAYDGKVVGGRSVGAHNNHVVHNLNGKAHVSVHRVVELDWSSLGRHFEAPYVRLSCFDASGCFSSVKIATGAVVARVASFFGFGLGALGVEFVFRAEARVHAPAFFHNVKRRAVGVHALCLKIWPVGTAYFGAFVPVQPKPLHGVKNNFDVFLRGSFGVGILNA